MLQKQLRLEVLAAGAEWWMARSTNAALMALRLSGVEFCRPWTPPQLERWEGPFADPTHRLPQAPEVKAERSAALKRWRQRQHERKAAQEQWRERLHARNAQQSVVRFEPEHNPDRDGRVQ